MWAFSSSKIVRFLLAPLLSLWVAGAGCMLGCEGMVAAAAGAIEQNLSRAMHSEHSSTIVASGHACSSGGSSAALSGEVSGSHNCCKKGTTEAEPKAQRVSPSAVTLIESGTPSSGTMKDCPLAGSKEAVVAKSRRSEASASPAVAHSYLATQKFLKPTPLSALPQLPNRGHTYLRCCVFLI